MGLLNTKTTKLGEIFIGVTEMADIVGCDPAHISRIMHKKTVPSARLAARMARYFDITVDQLFIELGIGGN